MYEFLIVQYIDHLTEQDITKFAGLYGIELKDNEIAFIYHQIKHNWRTILYGNPNPIFNEAKTKLSDMTYYKVVELYKNFKEKFQNYL